MRELGPEGATPVLLLHGGPAAHCDYLLPAFARLADEYRLVLLLEPENEAAKESYERMRRESEAERVLAAADLLVRQGRIEEARKIAEQGQRQQG